MATTDTNAGSGTATGSDYLFLTANFAPVTDERTEVELEVTGAIPPALDGRYLRTGPNPIAPDPATYHWFGGEGMVHGISLGGGRAQWYRNRWVRSPRVTDATGEPAVPQAEGGLYPGDGNTNVFGHAGRTWAITEGSLPYELSEELDTIRSWNFGGPMPAGMNAHPKIDPRTGDLHVVTYDFFQSNLRYLVVDDAGTLVRDVAVPLGGPVMVHDMGLTATRVVILDLPVVLDLEVAMGGASLPFRWDPDYHARVGLLPRDGGADDVSWVDLDPCYVYHPLNAYDDGTSVVIDLVVHPRAFDDPVRRDPSQGVPVMERWTIDPIAGAVGRQVLDDRGQEFPRPDERFATQRHRFGWSLGNTGFAALGGAGDDSASSILAYDLDAGTVVERPLGPGRFGGEFVFVPASADAAEGEGWLMGLVYDRGTDRSDLVILDATDLLGDPVATVHLPVRVPAGFHGNWVPRA